MQTINFRVFRRSESWKVITFPRLETTKPIENFFAARGVAYKSDFLTAEKREEDFAAEIEKMVKG